MPVNPYRPCAEFAGHRIGFCEVAPPDRSAQAEGCRVGAPQRLGVVLERHHGHHRPELLLVDQARALGDADQNGRQVEEARARALVPRRPCRCPASAEDAAAAIFCVHDQVLHVLQLDVVRQGPKLYTLSEAVTQAGAPCACNKGLYKLVEYALVDIDPLDGATSLTIVEEGGLEDTICRLHHVAVLANDGRIVAPKLEEDALEVLRASSHDLPADCR
mmetsp:Transcript_79458/g.170293  ORF Transcript_79458/g.170293 Transcript_79458/m.170293 type:complete len:218 (-) Transcript_79458:493-1146(-)